MFKFLKKDPAHAVAVRDAKEVSHVIIHVYPIPFYDGTLEQNFTWEYTVTENGSFRTGGTKELRTAYAAVAEAMRSCARNFNQEEQVASNPSITIHQSAYEYNMMLVMERNRRRAGRRSNA